MLQKGLNAVQGAAKPRDLLTEMSVPAVRLTSCAIQEAGVLKLTQLPLINAAERAAALDLVTRFRKEYAHSANPATLHYVAALEQSFKAQNILDAVSGKNKPTDDQVVALASLCNSFAVLSESVQTKLADLTAMALPSMLAAMSDKQAAMAGFDAVIKAAGHQPKLSKHTEHLLLGRWRVFQWLL